MKPRTKLEKDLQAVIDSGLKPLTAKQMEKGRRFDGELSLISVIQKARGMKMTKCYKVHSFGKGKMILYHLVIIKAERDGHTAWASRRTGMSFYMDDFAYDGEISIKNPHMWYSDYIKGATPVDNRVAKCDPYAVYREYNKSQYAFHDSRIETIAKNGDDSLIKYLMQNRKPLSEHIWRSYIVCHRHGYKIPEEAFFWVSLVNLLRANGRDTRNPHYICPENVGLAYNNMVDINDKRLRICRKTKREKEALEYKDLYVKWHKKWLGMVIRGRGITIRPLQNIEEFQDEGKAMHHCVFAQGYYKKRYSLIMSAKDKEGNRLATIEYDLKKQYVLQCRAEHNKMPKRYNEIVKLVEKRMKGATA